MSQHAGLSLTVSLEHHGRLVDALRGALEQGLAVSDLTIREIELAASADAVRGSDGKHRVTVTFTAHTDIARCILAIAGVLLVIQPAWRTSTDDGRLDSPAAIERLHKKLVGSSPSSALNLEIPPPPRPAAVQRELADRRREDEEV